MNKIINEFMKAYTATGPITLEPSVLRKHLKVMLRYYDKDLLAFIILGRVL